MLHEEYGKSYKVVHNIPPRCLIKLAACCNSDAKLANEVWGKEIEVDTSATTEVLGIKFTDIK